MSHSRIPPKEVEARGEQRYAEIRDLVDAGNHGKFVVIDVETGDYEVDARDAEATLRLLAKHPGGITYGVRIGSPTAYTLGDNRMARCIAGYYRLAV
jgi:hypothetical protein